MGKWENETIIYLRKVDTRGLINVSIRNSSEKTDFGGHINSHKIDEASDVTLPSTLENTYGCEDTTSTLNIHLGPSPRVSYNICVGLLRGGVNK
jgi:hypothetical protein